MSGEPNNEIVNATSLKSGKTATIRIKNPTLLNVKSGEAENYFVSVDVIKGLRERNAGSYVLRIPRYGEDGVIPQYMENYEFLLENGFPVPTTVRKIDGKDELLISDLRFKNKEVFSVNEIQNDQIDTAGKISNLDEVKEQLDKIADKGDKLSMLITSESYFVVFDPTTGRANIILGDLGSGIYTPDEYKAWEDAWLAEGYGKRTCKEEAERFYKTLVQGFVEHHPAF